MAINKVVYGNNTLLDLTEDTVTEEDVMEGKTFHDKSGLKRTGSATQGGRVQDVEVNGESVVNAQGVAEVVVPVIDDENISNESVYSSEKIEDRLDEYVDKDVAEVKSATDEFSTINGGLLSECKVALSPIQDLHGYDNPWVGGASKQLIPMTVNALKIANAWMTWNGKVATARGLTVTLLTDDAENVIGIDVDGTANERLDFSLGWVYTDGSYVVSGSTNGSLSKWGVWQRGHGSNESEMSLDGAGTFTDARQTDNECVLTIFLGATPSHQKFYPMLCLSSAPDPTVFAPYTNICPITGHTEVKIGDVGKNKWSLGDIITVQTDIPFSISAGTYTLSADVSNVGTTIVSVRFFYADGSNVVGTLSQATSYKATLTFTSDIVKVNAAVINGTATNVQLESGSIKTDFVPYNGYQVTVNLGGTYYSGTLDVVAGVFVPDKVGINLSDIGWSGSNGAFYSTNPISDIKHGGGRYDYATSSGYKTANKASLSQLTDGEMSVDASGYLQIKDNQYTSSASFVSDRGSIQIVYELATPTPIQLIPTPVKANVGENHLSAPLDGQEITESKYKEAFDFNDVMKVANYFTLPLQTFTFTNKVCNINDSRITSDSLVDVYFTSDSMSSVEDAGITVESQNGKIVMTAEEQPVGTIQGRIKVVN